MTKYKQKEYEALILDERPIITDVKVCNTMTNPPDMLTDRELVEITAVFRSFETGLREATIYPKDLHKAMKMLGLNPMEQEVVDIPNEIARNGLIYFPDFCEIILKRYRQDEGAEEHFRQNMFKMLCGTEPFPTDFKAKKYKLDKHFLSKEEFQHMMRNLPVPVEEEDIDEMFQFADKDNDGKLSYKEFKLMVNPPAPPEIPKPTMQDFNEMRARSSLSNQDNTESVKPEAGNSSEQCGEPSSPAGSLISRMRSGITTSPGSVYSKGFPGIPGPGILSDRSYPAYRQLPSTSGRQPAQQRPPQQAQQRPPQQQQNPGPLRAAMVVQIPLKNYSRKVGTTNV